MRDDFGIIVISHGRPNCNSVKVLRSKGYTGKIFIVVDDEDETLDEYLKSDDTIHVFHKRINFDIGDNFEEPKNVATFARNECWKVAEENNLKYFLMIDDDLTDIVIRYADKGKLKSLKIKNMDKILSIYCDFIDETSVSCTGFGDVGDYFGGIVGYFHNMSKRRIFNAYLFKTSEKFDFCGRYSEDSIAVVTESVRGRIFLGITHVSQTFDVWLPSRKNRMSYGGCQEAYKNNDSFILRFYAIMYAPSCIFVRPSKNNGWDNSIKKNNTFPKIISSRYKK